MYPGYPADPPNKTLFSAKKLFTRDVMRLQFKSQDTPCSKRKCGHVVLVLVVFLGSFTLFGLCLCKWWINNGETPAEELSRKLRATLTLEDPSEDRFSPKKTLTLPRQQHCSYSSCLNVYRCRHKLTIFLYPFRKVLSKLGKTVVPLPSKEFLDLRDAIIHSEFYTADPESACLFLPDIDTLNQNRLLVDWTSKALSSLEWWDGDGVNHLLFTMVPGTVPDFNETLDVATGKAMVAGSCFSSHSYRPTFDISIPVVNPYSADNSNDMEKRKPSADYIINKHREFLLAFYQPNVHQSYHQLVGNLAEENQKTTSILLLDWCNRDILDPTKMCRVEKSKKETESLNFPQILQESIFCLVLEGPRLGQTALSDALKSACIPVIVSDTYVLPFSEVLDWKRAAVQLYRHQFRNILEILQKDFSPQRLKEMRAIGLHFYENYFKNMGTIALTTLKIVQNRLFPHRAQPYEYWNEISFEAPKDSEFGATQQLPQISIIPERTARDLGFTAVILAYERLGSLFKSITHLNQMKSLKKIVVVWNNPNKSPPNQSEWPKTEGKSLHVIRTKENKLGNRFVPYEAIETEAILSLDDDIAFMLNADEVEFSYQAWREFPDHLVGFPSRVHVFNPLTQHFAYNSEWTNNVSIILTGAAFYHKVIDKYYGYLYTTRLPAEVARIVNDRMNCEDIAMNFLIANYTGRPPIKVTPRKKFRCPECSGVELAADSVHLQERSACVQDFGRIFGGIPLREVEFRVDPYLFRTPNIPQPFKPFPDVGHV